MIVAIDTATDTASLALVQPDRVLAELTWHCLKSHTTQLLPNLSYLLGQTGASLADIDGIIVAKGPGSYNGLRVGVSTAKGLAFSLKVPLVGISTLETAAYQHAGTGLPICPVLGAGRGEIATATYQMKDNRWRQLDAEHLTTPDALCARIKIKTIFCGEYAPVIAERLKESLGEKAVIATPVFSLRRAGFLAELGRARLEAGASDNPATMQALYLRGPAITEAKHR